MISSDPIADMLTRLRNATRAKHRTVVVPFSKLKLAVLDILRSEGFVESVETDPSKRTITVNLRYTPEGRPAIQSVERVSTPGHRRYVGRREIPRVLGGFGVAIVSTPRGVMTDREARRRRLGGELLCTVS